MSDFQKQTKYMPQMKPETSNIKAVRVMNKSQHMFDSRRFLIHEPPRPILDPVVASRGRGGSSLPRRQQLTWTPLFYSYVRDSHTTGSADVVWLYPGPD